MLSSTKHIWDSPATSQCDLFNKEIPEELQQTLWDVLIPNSPTTELWSPQPYNQCNFRKIMEDSPLFTVTVNDSLALMVEQITRTLQSLVISNDQRSVDVEALEEGLFEIKIRVDGLAEGYCPPNTRATSTRVNSPNTDRVVHEVSSVRSSPSSSNQTDVRNGRSVASTSSVLPPVQEDMVMKDSGAPQPPGSNGGIITAKQAVDFLFVPGRVTDTISQPLSNIDFTFPDGRSVKAELGARIRAHGKMQPQDIWIRTERCLSPMDIRSSYIVASITLKDVQHGHLTIARGHAFPFDPKRDSELRELAILAMMTDLDNCKRNRLADVDTLPLPQKLPATRNVVVGTSRGVTASGLGASMHGDEPRVGHRKH